MPWNQSHKEKTREKILAAAGDLFSEFGYDDVGIDKIMEAAGLTRGAFYSHFKSKSELYGESIITAAKLAYTNYGCVEGAENILKRVAGRYLGQMDAMSDGQKCPLAALITDVSQRDDTVRDVYTRVFKGFVKRLQDIPGMTSEKAMQNAVLMIGGVAIGRALSDENLKDELMRVCEEAISAKPA